MGATRVSLHSSDGGSLMSAGEADHLEEKYGMIGPKLLRFREKKRHIRQDYCIARDSLQKKHTEELFRLYKSLQLKPFDESHRLQLVQWQPSDWRNPWAQLWGNIAVLSIVCWFAFLNWAQDFCLEKVGGSVLRCRHRMESQRLYELYDGELWSLTTEYAGEYGWEAIEDTSGYFLRPETISGVSTNEYW